MKKAFSPLRAPRSTAIFSPDRHRQQIYAERAQAAVDAIFEPYRQRRREAIARVLRRPVP